MEAGGAMEPDVARLCRDLPCEQALSNVIGLCSNKFKACMEQYHQEKMKLLGGMQKPRFEPDIRKYLDQIFSAKSGKKKQLMGDFRKNYSEFLGLGSPVSLAFDNISRDKESLRTEINTNLSRFEKLKN
jgi:hypothetical protein